MKKIFVLAGLFASLSLSGEQEWKNVDFGGFDVREGSALDLSANIPTDAPVGVNGDLIVSRDGTFAFSSFPYKPVRFLGALDKMSAYIGKKASEKDGGIFKMYARQLRIQGYNLIFFDSAFIFDDDAAAKKSKFDSMDKLLAALKENGVYTVMSLGFYTTNLEDGYSIDDKDDMRVRLFFGDEQTRKRWADWCVERLGHFNKYTEKTWGADPAIFALNPYEGLDLASSKVFKQGLNTRSFVKAKWFDWLKTKYKMPFKLSRAWGLEFNLKGFEDIDVFFDTAVPSLRFENQKKSKFDKAVFIADWQEFVLYCADNFAQFADDTIRSSGYRGFIYNYGNVARMNMMPLRSRRNDISVMRIAFAPPSAKLSRGSKISQNSSIGECARYFRESVGMRFDNRPMLVRHTHYFWNKFEHEAGVLVPSYSSFQNYGAMILDAAPLTNFSKARILGAAAKMPTIPPLPSGNSPIVRANEFLASCLFLRGDVSVARNKISVQVSRRDCEDTAFGHTTMNMSQTGIALMSGIALNCLDMENSPLLRNVEKTRPSGVMPIFGNPKMRRTDWFVETVGNGVLDFNLHSYSVKLKRANLLGKENLSDPKKNIFHSDTDEILMKADENLLRVITPKSEAVSLAANKTESLNVLSVQNSSVDATVALCSVDMKNLADSSRMVLIYSTRAKNSGMAFSKDGTEIKSGEGESPILLETGKLDVLLNFPTNAKYELYALALDGTRRESIPFESESGLSRISIDTAALKNGATVFFELVKTREN